MSTKFQDSLSLVHNKKLHHQLTFQSKVSSKGSLTLRPNFKTFIALWITEAALFYHAVPAPGSPWGVHGLCFWKVLAECLQVAISGPCTAVAVISISLLLFWLKFHLFLMSERIAFHGGGGFFFNSWGIQVQNKLQIKSLYFVLLLTSVRVWF